MKKTVVGNFWLSGGTIHRGYVHGALCMVGVGGGGLSMGFYGLL